MIARSLKGKILVFAVFFVGITTGVLISNFYETRVAGRTNVADTGDRGSNGRRDVNRIHDYLGLDREQRQRVDTILEETRSEFRKLREETRPRFHSIEDQSQARIREVLNPDQLQKYEEFRRNVQQRRNADRGRRPRSD